MVLVLRHSNENRCILIDIQNRAHVYMRDGLWDNLSVPELQARNYGNVGTFKLSQTPECLHRRQIDAKQMSCGIIPVSYYLIKDVTINKQETLS